MDVADIRKKINDYYWYHCIDLGQGIITDGDYDISSIVDKYGFPKDMSGMSVLDVGRASGYFSFEFEKRGATVVATEIESFFDWDFVGGEIAKQARIKQINDEKQFSERNIYGAFDFAHMIKNSKVEKKFVNIYELSPEVFGGRKFDIVFCGSVTSHLRDPILALERLYSVTKGKCIISAPCFEVKNNEKIPLMTLVGTVDSDRRSWWVVNEKCIVEMLKCADFSNINVVSKLSISNRRAKWLVVPHLVVHAEVN